MTIQEMISKRRQEVLISLGYCDRKYSDGMARSEEYPLIDSETYRPYKVIPLQVTDEQFQQILDIEMLSRSAVKSDGGIFPKALCWTGVLSMVVCFIVGVCSALERHSGVLLCFLAWTASGVLFGMIWLWMGNVLKELRRK